MSAIRVSSPETDLKVVLLPLDIKLGDIPHNLAGAELLIDKLPEDTDLVVLPELSNVGFGDYSVGPEELAEPIDGRTIERFCKISAERGGMAIVGGFLRCEDGKLFNSSFFISDGKLQTYYDKRHLFAGAEQRIFERGTEQSPTVTFRGWRLRLAICYDLRFPVWNRSINCGYDALIVVANWPHSRFYAWKHLIIARAIENQAYVVACNREGVDVYGDYLRGDSMIVNAMGYTVDEKHDDGTVTGMLEAARLRDDRKFLQPWRVADEFKLL